MGQSDHLTALNAYRAFDRGGGGKYDMCRERFLGVKTLQQIAGISDLIYSQVNPTGVPGPAGFAYVKSVVVTNGGASQLANYAAMVTVAYVSGKMKTDFSDIRFTLDGSIIPLACWRRTYTASSTAEFWVNIPTLPTGATSINLFYGNAAAATTSSIQAAVQEFANPDIGAADAAAIAGGLAGYAFEPFYASLVPPGMPRAIMGTLADAIARAMSPPEFREQFVKIVGSEAVFNTPEQMLQMAKKEAELIDKIARAANIKEE